MKIVDLTMTISDRTPVFPGYPQPIVHKWTSISEQGYYSNILVFVEHTSTHVDAPAHFIENSPTIDEVSLDKFIGKGVVLDFHDLGDNTVITRKMIEEELRKLNVKPGPGWIILFYTGYDKYAGTDKWFKHPGLGEDASRYIAELGVNAVGIDAPSIDHEPFPAHKILLPKGIVIYENLTNLDKLIGVVGFKFIGVPLKIHRGSASPVRALAIVEE